MPCRAADKAITVWLLSPNIALCVSKSIMAVVPARIIRGGDRYVARVGSVYDACADKSGTFAAV